MLVDLFKRNTGEVVQKPDGEVIHTQGNGWSVLTDLFSMKQNALTTGNAHQFEDVYACINVLSDDVAKLPLKQYVKTEDKINKVPNTDTISYLLSTQPNEKMTPFSFKKLLMVSVLTHGNFYALLRFGNKGEVVEIMPLDANVTSPAVMEDGTFCYATQSEGKEVVLYNHEVLHIKGYSTDGIVGKSPIEVLRDGVESNHGAVQYNRGMMMNGGVPKGILQVAGSLGVEAKKKVKSEWVKVNGSDAIAVLDSGMEYKAMSLSQKDMEFIGSQKYNRQKIAAIYKVPLHKINDLDHATFSNIEHQSLDYVKNTLQPWIVQIEEELNRKLFTRAKQDEGYYVKFNLDSELRGDSESRAKVQEIKLRNGALTVNDIRMQDDYSPFNDIPLADRPLITLNYTGLDRLLEYQYEGVKIPVPEDTKSSESAKGGEKEE